MVSYMAKKYLFMLVILLLLLYGCSLKSNANNVIKEYSSPTEIYFCPYECYNPFLQAINSSTKSIHCAFYELDEEKLISLLLEKEKHIDVKILVDDHKKTPYPAKTDKKGVVMHDKFCVIDGYVVLTGSTNPTKNCFFRNNNNLVIIHSGFLASAFENEFRNLYNGMQGKRKIRNPEKFYYINNDKIEVLFCPQDFCADKVSDLLSSANISIMFMAFSLTNSQIISDLIAAENRGIIVSGIVEKSSQNSFKILNDSGLKIYYDNNPAKMHHKVFVIDSRIVITGSFNPTQNGDDGNDENLLIIYSDKIAKRYETEFESLV